MRWAGAWDPKQPTPAVRSHSQARLEPPHIVTLAGTVEAEVVADTYSALTCNATVELALGAGPSADETHWIASNLSRGKAFSWPVSIGVGGPGAYCGAVRLSAAHTEAVTPFDVVRLGTDAPVGVTQTEREGQPVWEIDNGLCQLAVAPGFGPSLTPGSITGQSSCRATFPSPATMPGSTLGMAASIPC